MIETKAQWLRWQSECLTILKSWVRFLLWIQVDCASKNELFNIILVAEDHEPSIGFRAAPSVEAHHHSGGPRNSGGRH